MRRCPAAEFVKLCNERLGGKSRRVEASAQDEHELGDVSGDLDALFALEAEAALLQDADRGDVVFGHARAEGTLGYEVQESGERPGRDTLAPMLLADPVADEADTVLGPAPDVARDLAIDEDRLVDRLRVAENVRRPMGVEGCAVAGGEGGQARGVGIELMLVEDGEIVGLDAAESYLVAHFSTPGQACRSIFLFALAMCEADSECRLTLRSEISRKRPI